MYVQLNFNPVQTSLELMCSSKQSIDIRPKVRIFNPSYQIPINNSKQLSSNPKRVLLHLISTSHPAHIGATHAPSDPIGLLRCPKSGTQASAWRLKLGHVAHHYQQRHSCELHYQQRHSCELSLLSLKQTDESALLCEYSLRTSEESEFLRLQTLMTKWELGRLGVCGIRGGYLID